MPPKIDIGSKYTGDWGWRQLRYHRRLPPGPPLELDQDWWIETRYLLWMAARTLAWFAVLVVFYSAVSAAVGA